MRLDIKCVFDTMSHTSNRTVCWPSCTPLCGGNGPFCGVEGIFGAVQVIIALLFGYMISAVITSDGGKKYIQASEFKPAPSITFLWVKNFGFGFYAPAVLPFLIGGPMLLD